MGGMKKKKRKGSCEGKRRKLVPAGVVLERAGRRVFDRRAVI